MSHGVEKNAKNGNGAPAPVSPRESSVTHYAPPDGGWGWMVVFASFMIHIITDGMTYSFGVFHSHFVSYFKEGQGKTAWIVSTLIGVTLSSGPISSIFVNRYGCRAVTVAGAILSSVCVIISSLADNVLTLIFTIGIGTGLGFGLIYLPAIVSVTVWFERRRSLATGIAVCGSGLGTFLFAPITSSLIEQYEWRGAMAIIGALIFNCVPLGFIFRPVPEPSVTPATEPMLPKANKLPLIRSRSSEQVVRVNGNLDVNDIARLTLSQPALNKPNEQKHRPPTRHHSGIMERPDVLYQGSMTSLFRSKSPERYQSNVSGPSTEDKCGWLPCSPEAKSALSTVFDLSLFVDPIFIVFAASNFLTSVGFYIPYVYIVPMAEKLNIENPPYLISIIGAANLVGRIVLGFISDKPWVNRLWAYNICLTIAGIGTALTIFLWEFWGLAAYSVVFGFTIGAYVGLTSVVLVDLLGIEKLTNAFGLLLLFQGIASLIGPPFAGWTYDLFKSYTPVFLLAGVTISLSGLILFFVPVIERRMNSRDCEQDTVLDEI